MTEREWVVRHVDTTRVPWTTRGWTHRVKRWGFGFLAFWMVTLLLPGVALAQSTAAKPRLLVLPWLVIDRTTNQECARPGTATGTTSAEARRLAMAAQESLDGAMHRHAKAEMIPRAEWAPHWRPLKPGQVFRQGPGCAICTPAGGLLTYDRDAVQSLGRAVGADYVWLGVTVTPLTPAGADNRPDDCCREALAQQRRAVLARSSALLVRVSDGEPVWQRDARRLERDVTFEIGRSRGGPRRTPQLRREDAVRDTARTLGSAFGREHRQALRRSAAAGQ